MKLKNITNFLLLLLLLLQLLPEKQVVESIYIDNIVAEELQHPSGDGDLTVEFYDEELYLIKNNGTYRAMLLMPNLCLYNYDIIIPATHNVETPPPNFVLL